MCAAESSGSAKTFLKKQPRTVASTAEVRDHHDAPRFAADAHRRSDELHSERNDRVSRGELDIFFRMQKRFPVTSEQAK